MAERIRQERRRIQGLLQDEATLDQAIANGEVQDIQIDLLQQFRDDPNALERYLNDTAKAGQEASKAEIQQRRQEAIREIEFLSRKSRIRLVTSSLRWAITYAVLGGVSLVNPNILKSQSH